MQDTMPTKNKKWRRVIGLGKKRKKRELDEVYFFYLS